MIQNINQHDQYVENLGRRELKLRVYFKVEHYFSLALVNQFQSDSHVCLGLFTLFFMEGILMEKKLISYLCAKKSGTNFIKLICLYVFRIKLHASNI